MWKYLTCFTVSGLFLPGFLVLAAANDLQLYPPAQPGYERMVIRLPPLHDTHPPQVESIVLEIIVGQDLKTDGCNNYWFRGTLTKKTVQGWGYPYYEVVSESQAYNPWQTAMLCKDQYGRRPQEQDTFVQMSGEGFLRAYGYSKVPIMPFVVYVPTGFEVRYRIWEAKPEIGKAHAE
jgi:ecotin